MKIENNNYLGDAQKFETFINQKYNLIDRQIFA